MSNGYDLLTVLSPYRSQESFYFKAIYCASAHYASEEGQITKFDNVVKSTGRTATIMKIVLLYTHLCDL